MQTANIATEAIKPPATLFIRKFLKYGDRIASIAPSSKALAAAMCEPVDASKPQVILELGAGTGAVTQVALRRMHPESKLFAVEIDNTFVKHLKEICPRAHVLHTDVRHADARLKELGIDKVDVVLNCLPTPSLPYEIAKGVYDCMDRVGKDAITAQLTVMPLIFLKYYRRLYEQVRFDLVMANLPPGGVYVCRNLRPNYADLLPNKR